MKSHPPSFRGGDLSKTGGNPPPPHPQEWTLKIRQSGNLKDFLFILGLNDNHQICGLGSDFTQKL